MVWHQHIDLISQTVCSSTMNVMALCSTHHQDCRSYEYKPQIFSFTMMSSHSQITFNLAILVHMFSSRSFIWCSNKSSHVCAQMSATQDKERTGKRSSTDENSKWWSVMMSIKPSSDHARWTRSSVSSAFSKSNFTTCMWPSENPQTSLHYSTPWCPFWKRSSAY